MKPGMKHLKYSVCAIGTVLPMLAGNVQAQQVPIPQIAAEVSGPAPGPMTKAYVQMVGRMAYLWGWPLCTFTTNGRSSRRFPRRIAERSHLHCAYEPALDVDRLRQSRRDVHR